MSRRPSPRRSGRPLLPTAVVAALAVVGGVGYAAVTGSAPGSAAEPVASAAVRTAPAPGTTATAAAPRGARPLTATVTPSNRAVVGVGMPVIVRFGTTITPAQRPAIQRALALTSTPAVVGSWSWTGAREVHYRPMRYWPAHTSVTVRLALDHVRASTTTDWRFRNRTLTFTTGDAVISRIDITAHRMVVQRNGRTVMSIPITAGKPGFVTRSGTKVVMEKYRTKIMDAATTGTPRGSSNYYRIKVQYAMRVTNSGEFLHAAPWSVASQGRANVSHGCVGMSTANAARLYAMSRIGDPVVVTGTTRGIEPGNGWTDWNRSWARWKAGSAVA